MPSEVVCDTCEYADHAGCEYVKGVERKDKPVIYCTLEYDGVGRQYSDEYLSKCPRVNGDDGCVYHSSN